MLFTSVVKIQFSSCFRQASSTSRGVIPSPPGIAWPGCLSVPRSRRVTLVSWSVIQFDILYEPNLYTKGFQVFCFLVSDEDLLTTVPVSTQLSFPKAHFFWPHCYDYADPGKMQMPCKRPWWETRDLPWRSF